MFALKQVSVAAAVAFAAFGAIPASATVITFASHGGAANGQTCYDNTVGATFTGFDSSFLPTFSGGSPTAAACTQITPHSLWKPGSQANVFVDDSSASLLDVHPVWISQDTDGTLDGFGPGTGLGGTLATPISNTDVTRPNLIVTQEFILTGSGIASLRQWADDTVDVYVDGQLLPGAATHNFSQNICANGSPGCEPGESSFGEIFLSSGAHVFTWVLWQVGSTQDANSNPFGLLYIGQINAVPEPSVIALFGLGLIGLGVARRRKAA